MSPPGRRAYGDGVYRRAILLRGRDGQVLGDLEDDFHRFSVQLEHDGKRVLSLRGEASRFPWTTCPGALDPLARLAGTPLSEEPTALAGYTDPRSHCTHLFDLAALAFSHAAVGRDERRYDIAVPDRIEGRTRATLHRDGAALLAWTVKGHEILDPPPFAGVRMRGSQFMRWAEENLEPDLAEAAMALRRTCYISAGRAHDLDTVPDASVYLPIAGSTCHTFTPGIAEQGKRVLGTSLDFTDTPDRLLGDVPVRGSCGR